MDSMPRVSELDVALDYVRNDQYALMDDYSILDYIMLQNCETYAMAGEIFNNAGFGFVLQENSKYLEDFNVA